MTNAPEGVGLPVKKTADGVMIAVRLTPSASVDKISGIETGADGAPFLKARVRAVPEKGKANAALIVLLAKWLGEPKTRFEIAAGGGSRLKQVLLRGDPDELMKQLKVALAHF
jgi:hypothetical protein